MDIIHDENPLQKSDTTNQKYTKQDFLFKVYMKDMMFSKYYSGIR